MEILDLVAFVDFSIGLQLRSVLSSRKSYSDRHNNNVKLLITIYYRTS